MEDPLTSSQSLRDSVCKYEKSQLKLDMENICLKQNDEQRILLCLDVLGLRVYKPIAIELQNPGTLDIKKNTFNKWSHESHDNI